MIQLYLENGLTFFVALMFWIGLAVLVMLAVTAANASPRSYQLPDDLTQRLPKHPRHRLIGGRWVEMWREGV